MVTPLGCGRRGDVAAPVAGESGAENRSSTSRILREDACQIPRGDGLTALTIRQWMERRNSRVDEFIVYAIAPRARRSAFRLEANSREDQINDRRHDRLRHRRHRGIAETSLVLASSRNARRLARGAHRVDDEFVDPALFLRLHPLVGIVSAVRAVAARNLAGDLRRNISTLNFSILRARFAREQALPRRLDAAAEWRHHSESRDDHPLIAFLALGARMRRADFTTHSGGYQELTLRLRPPSPAPQAGGTHHPGRTDVEFGRGAACRDGRALSSLRFFQEI